YVMMWGMVRVCDDVGFVKCGYAGSTSRTHFPALVGRPIIAPAKVWKHEIR
uniref:Uncharacterized protein n=1 Tax=Sander lucioperca TaxID=283035 RepID=A0A8D0D932_SANLU